MRSHSDANFSGGGEGVRRISSVFVWEVGGRGADPFDLSLGIIPGIVTI